MTRAHKAEGCVALAGAGDATAGEHARIVLMRLHACLVDASRQVRYAALAPVSMALDFRALRAHLAYVEYALERARGEARARTLRPEEC